MAEDETDLEKAQVKAAGLERWFRARFSSGLTKLVVVMIIVGGIITASSSRLLLTASICVAVFVIIAVVMTVRVVLILRALRANPEDAVARLTKRRSLQKAGFTPVS